MGDVRAPGDLGDRQPGKALLGDDRGGRVDDPLALVFDDELARQVVAPARQPALGLARALGGLRRGVTILVRRRVGRVCARGPRAGGPQAGRRLGGVGLGPRGELVRERRQRARLAAAQARRGHLADAPEDHFHGQIPPVALPCAFFARRRGHRSEIGRRSGSRRCSARAPGAYGCGARAPSVPHRRRRAPSATLPPARPQPARRRHASPCAGALPVSPASRRPS